MKVPVPNLLPHRARQDVLYYTYTYTTALAKERKSFTKPLTFDGGALQPVREGEQTGLERAQGLKLFHARTNSSYL